MVGDALMSDFLGGGWTETSTPPKVVLWLPVQVGSSGHRIDTAGHRRELEAIEAIPDVFLRLAVVGLLAGAVTRLDQQDRSRIEHESDLDRVAIITDGVDADGVAA